MRASLPLLLLAACGAHPSARPAPGPGSGTAPGSSTGSASGSSTGSAAGSADGSATGSAAGSAAGDATSDPGVVSVSGDSITVTLTGVKSVSTEPCRDLVSFQLADGAGWKDVTQTIHDKMYYLDGKQHGPGMCDYSPCHSQVPGADDVRLTAAIAGYVRTGDQAGLPAYATADLHGKVRVTFHYSTDGCQTYRAFTTTIDR
ncbi:MAG TPA: hypothetical protein VHE35_10735 [Kofleriaceae bacterium]|nr:hypothetical protein [Kofleriaceae bacterium]